MWGLLGRKMKGAGRDTSPAPGMRIYAVGDLHGRGDLFAELKRFVTADQQEVRPARPLTVFLGDLIDRGPDSAAIVQSLVSGDFPQPFLVLKGNHEQMMLDSLESDTSLEAWLRNGGVSTLQSYGVATAELADFAEVRTAMLAAVPQAHFDFIRNLPTAAKSGDYFFCHAGVRPGVPLDQQQERDLLWIRKPFLQSHKDFGLRVVHGHSPAAEPEILPNRINIDTGAYASGQLTCLVLDGTSLKVEKIMSGQIWV